jgi:hypothetical protein
VSVWFGCVECVHGVFERETRNDCEGSGVEGHCFASLSLFSVVDSYTPGQSISVCFNHVESVGNEKGKKRAGSMDIGVGRKKSYAL